jgi:cellulase/cellobiase CelA1
MPFGGEWIPVLDEMQPNASLQTYGYSDCLIWVARAPEVEGSPQLIDRDLGHHSAQHAGPEATTASAAGLFQSVVRGRAGIDGG